jgi:flagellar FliL protein
MSKSVLIIIISIALLFMGMMGAGFFILWTKMQTNIVPPQGAGMTAEETEEENDTIGPLYSLGTLIVNLADQGGKRYLRVTMELELEIIDMADKLEKRKPQIRDSVLMILATKSYADINTTEGKITLRDELMAKLNSFFKEGGITNIYFTEFVVQ